MKRRPLLQGRGAETDPNQPTSLAKAEHTHGRQSVVVFMSRDTEGGGLDGDASKEESGAQGRRRHP
jgi:hypothetical protein